MLRKLKQKLIGETGSFHSFFPSSYACRVAFVAE